ncbi:cysteine desulfurase family protein [Corynebacterium sp. MSK008]|uniref:cysteine desulfurase family protein n=1 Tax=Corynebacterium sp. MSK008 TaxID=3050188 RepID=UPI002551AAAB|nr:cysteine desulfurase family protein [Corynebacterium sp. MSK008]MDK8879459.1 cysteine desulfurase family protein [Corynebacterium sp. MSK008]
MVYLDHAATTPMRQSAIDAWVEHAGALNAGSQHAAGRKANAVLADARERIAAALGADPVEVVFTGSGTEANNIGVRGLWSASGGGRVVSTPIEHPAVLEVVKPLGQTEWLPVAQDGVVSDLSVLDTPAAVAAVMWANNETGAIQPVREAVTRAEAAGTPVHVDAVQAVGHIPVHFHELGAATLAASAHKFGGPRGMGLLLARRSPAPKPVILGGGQERGIRSGTVDVASAAATAAALEEAVAEMAHEQQRIADLRDAVIAGVKEVVPEVIVAKHEPCLPGHAHFMFPGANADALIMLLDAQGIQVSAGSACASGVLRMSHVLEAMGFTEREAMGALRVTVGRTNTREDVDAFLAAIPEVVERARAAGAL